MRNDETGIRDEGTGIRFGSAGSDAGTWGYCACAGDQAGRFAGEEADKAYRHSNEVKILKGFAREVRRKLPIEPMEKLQRQLRRAIKDERYEDAAKLRDEIIRHGEARA